MMLTFITLNTGNVVHYEANMIAAGYKVQHPLTVGKNDLGNDWSVRLRLIASDYAIYEMYLDGIHVTHCWLCRHAQAADTVWQMALDEQLPILQYPERPSTVPWLAVGMALDVVQIVASHRMSRLPEAPLLEAAVAFELLGDG